MHKGRIGQTKIKIKNCPVSVSETEVRNRYIKNNDWKFVRNEYISYQLCSRFV